MALSELQHIADVLAAQLHRSVAINDYALDLLTASAQDGDIDRYRIDSIVRRHTPGPVLSLLQERELLHRTEPYVLEEDALPGMLARMCVPVVDAGVPIAFIWIVLGAEQTLTTTEFTQVTAASAATLAALRAEITPETDRHLSENRLLQNALGADEYAAGFAIAALTQRGVLDDDADAVVIVQSLSSLEAPARGAVRDETRRALIAAMETWSGAAAICALDGRLVTVTSARSAARYAAAADEAVDRALAGTQARRTASGRRSRRSWAQGLHEARDEAVFAAQVAAVRGTSSLDYAELGGFAALRHLPWTDETVALISPEAAALRAQGNDVARETVQSFLDNAGNVQRTCQDLSIHRATFYYRIDRVRDLLGDALDDGGRRTALHLGLLLGLLIDSNV